MNNGLRAPAMFISHGSPMWALDPGVAGQHLVSIRQYFAGVKALLVVSPHWLTRGLQITAAAKPETIHDFGGFPQQLYRLQYPVAGAPELAADIVEKLSPDYSVELNNGRGLDHGVWVPLLHMLPDADIPVLQLSLDMTLPPDQLVELGTSLSQFREQGIAVIASGGLTHNLYDMVRDSNKPAAYAERFQGWVRDHVQRRNVTALCQPHIDTKEFQQAHPTPDHYLPLLVGMGASREEDQLKVLQSPIEHHSISMESYFWN